MNQADRDELAGQDWLRSLTLPEHAALPLALDAGAHIFQAVCRCGWRGPVHRWRDRNLHNLNNRLWLAASVDADAHTAEFADVRRTA